MFQSFKRGIIKNYGQNLIEFVIIITLIVIAAILALTLLGDNIKGLFSGSYEKSKAYKPFDWEAPTAKGSSDPVPVTLTENMPSSPVISSKKIAGQEISYHEDGAATISVSGQELYIASSMMEQLDEVFEVVGSQGLNDHVVGSMLELIERYAADYPEGVPIQMATGVGDRVTAHGEHYKGKTSTVNLVQLNVGGDVIILQKDQEGGWSGDVHIGTYKIDLNLDTKTNKFNASSIGQIANVNGGKPNNVGFAFKGYSGDFTRLEDGRTIFDGKIKPVGNWKIEFDKPQTITLNKR